jgi:hypothetical protein
MEGVNAILTAAPWHRRDGGLQSGDCAAPSFRGPPSWRTRCAKKPLWGRVSHPPAEHPDAASVDQAQARNRPGVAAGEGWATSQPRPDRTRQRASVGRGLELVICCHRVGLPICPSMLGSSVRRSFGVLSVTFFGTPSYSVAGSNTPDRPKWPLVFPCGFPGFREAIGPNKLKASANAGRDYITIHWWKTGWRRSIRRHRRRIPRDCRCDPSSVHRKPASAPANLANKPMVQSIPGRANSKR